MNIFRAVQLIAFNSVVNPDGEYKIRKILRWYSKTFHTPLHITETLPLETILTHYFESIYEEMEEDELEAHKLELLETQEQRLQRIMEQEKNAFNDEMFYKQAQEEAKKQPSKAKPQARIITPKVRSRDPVLSDGVKASIPEQDEIKIEYVDDNLFEEELTKSSVGPPSKKDSNW